MMRSSRHQGRRLRKQPKIRRVQKTSTLALPKIVVPPAAKKRKRRNDRRIQVPLEVFKNLAITSRWISLALLVICIWALLLIGQNGNFYLSVIPVLGSRSIPESEIVEASGLEGSHIFSADPSEAARRINEIPGVISATVTLQWPNEVNIQVGEDTPIAIWKQAGRTYWINESGQLLPARSTVPGLLVIDSEQRTQAKDNGIIDESILNGALQLQELRPNIDLLHYLPGTGLSYEDGRGWRGHFGTGTDMEQKIVVYETIIDELLERGLNISYVSVRNQAKPHYMAEPAS
ncbi:MAG: FtsQ-type POTRA domain-containing protein [Candidatus Promineifilaceae bacterium]